MATENAAVSRRLCRGLTILWVAVLWVPVLQMVFHLFPERSTLAENRVKASLPRGKGGLPGRMRAFPKDFDWYFSDNFGFRDSLVRSHASLLYRILGTSPNDNVVLGREGWLYYNGANDGQSIKDYCGLATFSARDLEVIERNLTSLASYLRERGILFALVVGPSKHTIYPEYLPDGIRSLAGETQFDQLTRLLAGHPEILFVDPRRALAAGKSRSQLYFKTDTHWNGAGAFLVYKELMKALERAGAPVRMPSDDDYRLEHLAPAARDLSLMLGVPGQEKEEDLNLERLSAPRYSVPNLPVAPGDNSARANVVCETDDPAGPRLVVIRDSFAEHLKPLLCPDFSRSAFFWRHSVDVAMLAAEKPSILVLEIAERYLGKLQKKGGLLRIVEPAATSGGPPGS